jgi:hypothetical protein
VSKYISLALLIKQPAGVVKNIVYLRSTPMYFETRRGISDILARTCSVTIKCILAFFELALNASPSLSETQWRRKIC